jgi:hypothetical protein
MQVETLRKAIEGAGFVEVKIEEKEEVRAPRAKRRAGKNCIKNSYIISPLFFDTCRAER